MIQSVKLVSYVHVFRPTPTTLQRRYCGDIVAAAETPVGDVSNTVVR